MPDLSALPAAPADPDLSPIEQAEQTYGFTFGDPTNEAKTLKTAKPTGIASCVAPDCSRRGEMVHVYPDTELPLHCGSCYAILQDDPNRSDVSRIPGLDTTDTDAVYQHIKQLVLEELRAEGKA